MPLDSEQIISIYQEAVDSQSPHGNPLDQSIPDEVFEEPVFTSAGMLSITRNGLIHATVSSFLARLTHLERIGQIEESDKPLAIRDLGRLHNIALFDTMADIATGYAEEERRYEYPPQWQERAQGWEDTASFWREMGESIKS